MKFKKLLSFTLATTMAFTATLSSSISSSAVGNQKTEENQSFASSIFDELLVQSKESNIENPDEYAISPLWSRKNHQKIIENNEGDLPEYHIRILKATADWADRWFSPSANDEFATPALHGAGNYVINLEFLWYFSVFLGREKDPQNATEMNNAIISARSKALQKIKDTTAYKNIKNEKDPLKNLIKYSETLVKYDGWAKKYDTKRTSAEMKMRILGYAAHLAGDVYAHRTILQNTNRLTMSLFTNNLADDVSSGIVEYRFLAKTPDKGGYLLDENKKTHVNETCVDCKNYCPNRYNDAKQNVSCMVTCKEGAFDYYIFLCPHSYNIKLSKLKKFVKDSGLNTSRLTSSEWARIST